MHATGVRFAYSCMVVLLCVALAEATINVEVQLYNYSNPQHSVCDGGYCDYSNFYRSIVCNNAFVFSLRTSSNPPITYDVMTSRTVTNDLFTFTSSVVENPLVFHNLAPKDPLTLQINVFKVNRGVDTDVDKLYIDFPTHLPIDTIFSDQNYYHGECGHATISLSYRITSNCPENFYGYSCTQHCEPDEQHYCNYLGQSCRDLNDTSNCTSQAPETICSNGEVRLVNGSSLRNGTDGRVEICVDNQWGTICDDDWSSSDAEVVCRQLGLPTGSVVTYIRAHFGKGYGPIVHDLGCSGEENRVTECDVDDDPSLSCSHSEDAGVYCRVCAENDIRLNSNSSSGQTEQAEGRLEICRNGLWNPVCAAFWSQADAMVACYQLGYLRRKPTLYIEPVNHEGPIVVDNLRCYGNEYRLASCPSVTGRYDCPDGNITGLKCRPRTGYELDAISITIYTIVGALLVAVIPCGICIYCHERIRITTANQEEFQHASSKFRQSWVADPKNGPCPEVKFVFVIKNPAVKRRWSLYKLRLKIMLRPTNVEQYFHGTKLDCKIIKRKSICHSRNCGICGISKFGFDRNKRGSNIAFTRFGYAYYLAPNSSKSNFYANKSCDGYHAMLLCDTLPGRKYEVVDDDRSRKHAPAGYDCVYGRSSCGHPLNYDEIVFYKPEPVVPRYIIVYIKNPLVPNNTTV